METTMAITVGVLVAAAVYLLLQPHIVRLAAGLILLSHAVNLIIFAAGTLRRSAPPLIRNDNEGTLATVADPLPQAMVLTAIVISFAAVAFALVLFRRAADAVRSAETHSMGTKN